MKNSFLKLALISATALTGFSASALAEDGADTFAKERFQVRVRAIDIVADGDGVVNGTTLKTDVDHAITPEVDVSYFFTDNIAAELIAATAEHEVSAGAFDLGDTWILPPTLTLQYHFTPDSKFSPYVGAGLNYSYFYSEDTNSPFTDLEVDGGFGLAFQAGFDYWLDEHWGVNFDAKYVELDIDAKVKSGGAQLSADDVELDPVIIGAGISYRY